MFKQSLKGYDVSFLITNEHLEKYKKKELIEFIVGFIGNVEKDLSDIKLNIIQQARKSITFFAKAISKDLWEEQKKKGILKILKVARKSLFVCFSNEVGRKGNIIGIKSALSCVFI